MKVVQMNLYDLPFKQIKEGSKTVEVRLNDEKRKSLEIGDFIEFKNIETKETIKKEIENLKIYANFEELYDNYDEIFDNYFWVMVATIDENSIFEYVKIHCK